MQCLFSLCLLISLSAPALGETVRYHHKVVSGLKYLDVSINGIPIEMVFDTGSSHIVLNADAIQRLGVWKFEKRLTGDAVTGSVEAYSFLAGSVRVGSLELKNVEIHYIPNSRMNLLGGTFLDKFNYFVSERDKSITFFPYNAHAIAEGDSYLYLHIDTDRDMDKATGRQ